MIGIAPDLSYFNLESTTYSEGLVSSSSMSDVPGSSQSAICIDESYHRSRSLTYPGLIRRALFQEFRDPFCFSRSYFNALDI